jgi:hypothetical protein
MRAATDVFRQHVEEMSADMARSRVRLSRATAMESTRGATAMTASRRDPSTPTPVHLPDVEAALTYLGVSHLLPDEGRVKHHPVNKWLQEEM